VSEDANEGRSAGLHIGTAGWSYADWSGLFYPEGMPAAGYLAYYGAHFGAVEIDSTFYGTPRPEVVSRWAEAVPPSFQFCPKMVRTVTHEKRLQGAESETAAYLEALAPLGERLGPIVLQFDYSFGPTSIDALAAYLEALPTDRRFAVEVRDRGWLAPPLYRLLSRTGVALVLQDIQYMPRLDVLTTDFTYVRWIGQRDRVPGPFNRVVIDRGRELDWWAERVANWLSQGIRVYCFANNHYQGYAPATVADFLARLAAAQGSGDDGGVPPGLAGGARAS
jgi:uncharacterized protein YecE (DUF72 family)